MSSEGGPAGRYPGPLSESKLFEKPIRGLMESIAGHGATGTMATISIAANAKPPRFNTVIPKKLRERINEEIRKYRGY